MSEPSELVCRAGPWMAWGLCFRDGAGLQGGLLALRQTQSGMFEGPRGEQVYREGKKWDLFMLVASAKSRAVALWSLEFVRQTWSRFICLLAPGA